jgi:DNA-binding response OmpR family regulator
MELKEQRTKHRILIVDDDPEMRLALQVRLKANNYDVAVAVDGVSGISETRKHMPDLILLDLGLPAGDGFTVLERLAMNDSLAHIPVVVLSGRDRAANCDRALKAGARVFLQKPVRNSDLLSTINQVLSAPHPPRRWSTTSPTPRARLTSTPALLAKQRYPQHEALRCLERHGLDHGIAASHPDL